MKQISDTVFTISGIDLPLRVAGDYTLGVDLTRVEKYISGLKGSYSAEAQWTILNTNSPPVANAGENFSMLPGKQYWLNASASSDADNDNLVYEWFPPAGIVLDDRFSATPSFFAVDNADTTEFTFLLSVSDGYTYSTDRVTAYLQKISGTGDLQDISISIWPNPTEGRFTISASGANIESVWIFDFSGKVIMQRNWTGEKEQTFNMSGVPAGMYIIQAKTEDRVIMRKIVIY